MAALLAADFFFLTYKDSSGCVSSPGDARLYRLCSNFFATWECLLLFAFKSSSFALNTAFRVFGDGDGTVLCWGVFFGVQYGASTSISGCAGSAVDGAGLMLFGGRAVDPVNQRRTHVQDNENNLVHCGPVNHASSSHQDKVGHNLPVIFILQKTLQSHFLPPLQ